MGSWFNQTTNRTICSKSGNRVLRSSLTLEVKNGSLSNSAQDTLQFSDALSGFTFALFPNPAEQEVSISTQPEFVQQGEPVSAGGCGNGFVQSYAGSRYLFYSLSLR